MKYKDIKVGMKVKTILGYANDNEGVVILKEPKGYFLPIHVKLNHLKFVTLFDEEELIEVKINGI